MVTGILCLCGCDKELETEWEDWSRGNGWLKDDSMVSVKTYEFEPKGGRVQERAHNTSWCAVGEERASKKGRG